MKTFIALLVFALAATFSSAQPAPDLKSAVAAWFNEKEEDGRGVQVTLILFLDGKDAKTTASIRERWNRHYAPKWKADLIRLAKAGTESPQDRSILADMRAAHTALADSEKDRAKFDEAVRRLKTLRQRVGA